MKILIGTLSTFIFSLCAVAEVTYANKQKIKISPLTCEKAYKTAKNSPTKLTVFDADKTCGEAAQAACVTKVEKDSDGPNTGDGKWIAASCELSIAYGANKAVNKGAATKKCEKAATKAFESATQTDLFEAADICKKEQDSVCIKIVNDTSDGPNTGDGQLVSASCNLIASHGSFIEVTKKTKSTALPQVSPAPKANSTN